MIYPKVRIGGLTDGKQVRVGALLPVMGIFLEVHDAAFSNVDTGNSEFRKNHDSEEAALRVSILHYPVNLPDFS